MVLRFDLHAHTLCSDGTLTPAALVARASEKGVDVLAVTDHDCTDGLAEAGAEALRRGLTLVPGVEISATWESQTVHIVGLDIEPGCSELQRGLTRLREHRRWRAREIGARLARHRIHGAFEGASQRAAGAIVSRTHFARFLVEQGYVASLSQAFKRYLGRGTPGHVPGQWATLAEAVGWIRAARGQAVIAHPARYRCGAGKLRRLLAEFKDCGGAAIEVIAGNPEPQAIAHFAGMAKEFGLHASLGSDYHGPESSWLELGRLAPLPADCTPVWELWNATRNESREARDGAVDSRVSSPVPRI